MSTSKQPEPLNPRRLNPRYWEEEAKCFGRDVERETKPVLVRLGIPDRGHTELFYPPRGGGVYHDYTAEAKKYCFGPNGRTPCPVRRQCLAWAIVSEEEHGIWGGLSHRERNALVRKAEKKGEDILDHISAMER